MIIRPKFIFSVLMLLLCSFLVGCTTPTGVIVGIEDGSPQVIGFTRAQKIFPPQCIACTSSFIANVEVRAIDETLICKGSTIVLDLQSTENYQLKVSCSGLEDYTNKTVKVNFSGERLSSGSMIPFTTTKEVVVEFGKI